MGKTVKNYLKVSILIMLTFSILNYIFGTVCVSRILFGIPCPGCGLTRAFIYLVQFKFIKSFEMHPLLISFVIGIILIINGKKYKIEYRNVYTIYGIILLVIMFIIYLYRMKALFPNVEPMKYHTNNLLARVIRDIN